MWYILFVVQDNPFQMSIYWTKCISLAVRSEVYFSLNPLPPHLVKLESCNVILAFKSFNEILLNVVILKKKS